MGGRVQRAPVAGFFTWYCELWQFLSTSTLSITQGYETPTFGFFSFVVVTVKSCGKIDGKTHQIPSVSSSSVLPSCSTSVRASLMMLAPVYVTTPAISMLYHRAPLRIT